MTGSTESAALPKRGSGMARGIPRFMDAAGGVWRHCLVELSRITQWVRSSLVGLLFLALLASIVLACATLVYVLLVFRIYPGRPSENKASAASIVRLTGSASDHSGHSV
jgi:hypothetical protein